MNAKLKLAGFGILAVTLVGGVSVLSAFASPTKIHFISEAPIGWTHVGASQVEGKVELHDLESEISMSCETATATGDIENETVIQVTLYPTYKSCSDSLFTGGPTTVTMNGCDYLLTSGSSEGHSPVHLVCPVGKEMEILDNPPIVGTCTYKLPSQLMTGGITYTNIGSGKTKEVVAKMTLGVYATKTETSSGCLGTEGGLTSQIELTGTMKAKGLATNEEQYGIEATPPYSRQKFHAESMDTVLEGAQSTANEYTFGILVGGVECGSMSFSGTVLSEDAEEVTLVPSFTECEGLERQVTPKVNGCSYRLAQPTDTGSHGQFSIQCPEGKAIEFTYDEFAGGCTITVGPQTPSGVVDYEEEGSGVTRDLLLTWTLTGIKYKRVGCEVGGEGSNGTYTGSITLKGEDEAEEQTGVWLE